MIKALSNTRLERQDLLRYVLIVISGFLLSRVILPGGVIPLGFGFFAASLEYNVNSIITAVCVIAGALSTGFNARSMTVIMSVLVMSAFKILASGGTKGTGRVNRDRLNSNGANGVNGTDNTGNISVVKSGGQINRLLPFILSGIVGSAIVVIVNGFVMYDLIMALIQNAIAVIGYFIFQSSIRAFSTRSGRYILKEDVSSIAITLILCVFGFPQINLFGLNLRNVIGVFLIIMFSYKGSYGLLSRLGKWGTCIGVGVLAVGLTFMMGAPDNIVPIMLDVLAADFLFFMLPEKLLNKLKLPGASNINVVVEKANYSDEMAKMMVGRLESFSQSYQAMAKSFAKFARGGAPETSNNKILIERVGARVCESCDMSEFCWKRMKTSTSKAFLDLCETLERNGKILWDNVPEFFKEECEKTESILTELRVGYEVSRVEKIWSQRLSESKDVYSIQLGSLAAAAHSLAQEMKSDIKLMVKLSEALEIEFRKSGYKGLKATVIQNRFGKYEVSVDMSAAGKRHENEAVAEIEQDEDISNENEDKPARDLPERPSVKGRIYKIISTELSKIVSGVLNAKMVLSEDITDDILKFVEANRLRIDTGAICISKNAKEVSGDSYTFINSGNGSFAAVLCDGMGTGKKAREQSNLAIRMIENFSFNGFDHETAIEMINSTLVMKSEEDSYSTLDLVSINLQNGNVDILKYGGMPTVIKYKLTEDDYTSQRQYLPNIESISGSSLPVGIMNRVSSRSVKKKVGAGDMIVMMTDGVFDAYRQAGKTSGDLIRFIESTECETPKEFAEKIMNEALLKNTVSYKKASGEVGGDLSDSELTPPDDMTVLVMMVDKE